MGRHGTDWANEPKVAHNKTHTIEDLRKCCTTVWLKPNEASFVRVYIYPRVSKLTPNTSRVREDSLGQGDRVFCYARELCSSKSIAHLSAPLLARGSHSQTEQGKTVAYMHLTVKCTVDEIYDVKPNTNPCGIAIVS